MTDEAQHNPPAQPDPEAAGAEEASSSRPPTAPEEARRYRKQDGGSRARQQSVELSVVVPVLDEEESLPPLYRELSETLEAYGKSYELIFVDDYSSDSSRDVMLELRRHDPHVRVVCLRRNFGQTSAMSAGFDHSRGAVVVTIDGDLQNDPADIPRLVSELEKGFDVVAGWRRQRHDGFVLRKLPSRVANRLINAVTGTQIHDTGCTLKAFRRQVVQNLPIYAEQHRFLPAMSLSSGARVTELVVNHRARKFGRSKYGLGRAVRVLLDLFVIKMIGQFAHHPLHYFGLFSLPFALMGGVILVFGTLEFHERQFELDATWPQFTLFMFLLFLMLTVYFVLLGLLSELAVTASGMHRRRVLDRIVTEA